MSKLDESPKYRAQLPKNLHDLSHDFGFTASTGMILPVFHDLANPGEKYRLGFDFDLRTTPLANAAYVDVDVNVKHYFVPMDLIYSAYSSFAMQISDVFSRSISIGSNVQYLPIVDFHSLWEYLLATPSGSAFPLYQQNLDGQSFDSVVQQVFRLMEHLDFNGYDFVDSLSAINDDGNPNVFPYAFAAYQAIYQYEFRDDDREVFDNKCFNLDNYAFGSTISAADAFRLFRLRYCFNRKDYFNSMKNSPIVTVTNVLGQPSALPLADSWLTRQKIGTSSILTNGSQGDTGAGGSSSGLSSDRSNAVSYAQTTFGFTVNQQDVRPPLNAMDINTANIRALFANEKLWSITGRTRKTYDAQTLAHFGYKVPVDVKHQLQLIGSSTSRIRIGEVIATAGTSENPLGDIAGKGFGKSYGQTFDFVCPCHGVVMSLFYVVPSPRYPTVFMKYNALTQWTDLFHPEFDHLGMQPLFNYEFRGYIKSGENGPAGWQYRYEQYKRRYNKVTSAFATPHSNDVSPFKTWMNGVRPFNNYGGALQTQGVPSSSLLNLWHCPPTALNGLFLYEYNTSYDFTLVSNPELMYSRDPFIIDGHVIAKKISLMSDYSLPELD